MAQASSVAVAISGDLKHMQDDRAARLAGRCSEVPSWREHPSPPGAGVLHALGRGPWVEALVFNFLKTELRVHLLPVRALSFLVKGCNSSPAVPALFAKEKLPLNQSSLRDLLTPFFDFLITLPCVREPCVPRSN